MPVSAVVAESPADFRAWIEGKQAAGRFIESGWGPIAADMWRGFEAGDNRLTARSDKMLTEIEAASPLAAIARETIATVSGGAVNVAAHLAGSPVPMRRRVKVEAPAPLKIVVDVGASATLSNEIIERRGVAVLALLRLLVSAGHAIEVYTVHANGNAADGSDTGFAFMRLETSPLDVARAAWVLSSPGFGRYIGYAASSTMGGKPLSVWPWANNKWNGNLEAQTEAYALGLGCQPEDLIVLPPLFSGQQRDILKTDEQAAEWVAERYKETLAKHALAV